MYRHATTIQKIERHMYAELLCSGPCSSTVYPVVFAVGIAVDVACKANRIGDGLSAVIRGSIAVDILFLDRLVDVARDMNITQVVIDR
jgi:hypothetical protein